MYTINFQACSCKSWRVPISFIMSVCPRVSTQLPPNRHLWNLILGILWKTYQKNQNLVTIADKNIGTFTRRHTCVSLLLTLNCHKSALFEWNGIRLSGEPRKYTHYGKFKSNSTIEKALLHYIVVSDIWRSTIQRKHNVQLLRQHLLQQQYETLNVASDKHLREMVVLLA